MCAKYGKLKELYANETYTKIIIKKSLMLVLSGVFTGTLNKKK